MIDTNELRRLAQAATPGPWHVIPVGDGRQKFAVAGSEFLSILTVTDEGDATFGTVYDDADAEFIAAANPTAISKLLDRLEAAEKECDNANAAAAGVALQAEALQAKLDAAEKERDALRAKIAEMEQQEPAGFLDDDGCASVPVGWKSMTDHANELRRHARKIPHQKGETPGVMLRAADEIERLQSVIASPYSMTRDDVIRMAREAGDDVEHTLPSDLDFLERFASLVAAAEREASARHFRPEMRRMWVNYERAVKILTSIHALLYPPVITDANGKTWRFKSPVSEEQMQELSDRIRAIPDELAALDAAAILARKAAKRAKQMETKP